MLCPGRHISADAGIAAAVAVEQGVYVRNADIRRVQDILVSEDVPLPRHPGVDRSYQECVEEHQYGLYTDLAKKAHENPEEFEKYRQSGIGGWESYIKNQKAGH